MSEMRDLVAIFGAIDQRLVDSPQETREHVALLLPRYRDPDVQWYDELVRWVLDHRESDEQEPFPDLETAVKNLSKVKPEGRMLARRVLAVAAASRALPEVRSPESPIRAFATRALITAGLTETDKSDELLDFLAEPEADDDFNLLLPRRLPTPDEYWNTLLARGHARKLLVLPSIIGRRPCSATITPVDEEDAVMITASVPTTLGFDAALGFLNPENWVETSAFWCEMKLLEEVAPNHRRYLETVSVDCPNKKTTWQLRAHLDFVTTITRDATQKGVSAQADYQLSPDHPQPGDDVEVDHGTLLVEPIAGGTLVTATKVVRFSGAFSGTVLAPSICGLGYADALEDLIERSAGMPGPEEEGPAPQRRGLGPAEDKPDEEDGAGKTQGEPLAGDSLANDIIDRAANMAKTYIDDCAVATAESARKIADGEYGVKELVHDVGASWTRMLRAGARGVTAIIDTSEREQGRGR